MDQGTNDTRLLERLKSDIVHLKHELGCPGQAADACIFIVSPKTIAQTLVRIGTALADPVQIHVPILIVENGPPYTLTGAIHSTYDLSQLRWHLSRAEPL